MLSGITMALGTLLGWSSPGGYFGLIEGHVHANVWGFLALVVVWTSPLVAADAAQLVAAAGYGLVLIGFLPPLATLLRQLLARPLPLGEA